MRVKERRGEKEREVKCVCAFVYVRVGARVRVCAPSVRLYVRACVERRGGPNPDS